MSEQSRAVEVKAKQRAQARRATLEAMLGKQPAREEFSVPIGEGGTPMSLLFVAIGATEYDELVTKHPATAEQMVKGASFNINTFGPALLSKVCRDPALSVAEWTQVWKAPQWSSGEISDLYSKAVELCVRGVDLTPIAAG